MAGGEQHSRHGQHALHALLSQAIQPIAQDRTSKFQVAVLHGHARQQRPQTLRQLRELSHRLAVAAAMAADHHADRSALHGP